MNIKSAMLWAALGVASFATAAELPLPKDGWASWQVEAVEDAEAWCCWNNWDDRNSGNSVCNLDGNHQGYGTRDHTKTDAIRMYARFKAGKVERVRALAASCPVETKTPIQKLDNVATDDSARWLVSLEGKDSVLATKDEGGHDVLAALSMHKGNVAFTALVNLTRNGDEELRKQATFWLGMMRGIPGAEVATNMMFNDPSPELRKHGAFVVTQSKSPLKTQDLTKLGNTDKDADVRAQAWFWLAQSGEAGAEASILAAAKNDKDDHVREQAIFALSQLKDERAPKALIAVAEDKSFSNEQRKRALFWLGQSESASATAYLDKVLAGNSAR